MSGYRVRTAVLLASAALIFCASCGKKPPSSEAAHTEASGITSADTGYGTAGERAAEQDQASGTGSALREEAPDASAQNGAAEAGAVAGGPEAASAAAETWYAPETGELTVTEHKQAGTHMVTAGSLTISIPTTFPGLEKEGAEFSGDREIVRAGRTGSCRVKYKGAFNSIQINVRNNTDYDMAVRDCTVCGIEVGSQKPDSNLTLYGIPMGATRQQIADVYGEPFSKTFDDADHMSNMVYQFGTDIYSSQVVIIIFKDSKAVSASYDDFSLARQ